MKIKPIDTKAKEGTVEVKTLENGWQVIQQVLPNQHIEIKLKKPRSNAK